MGKVRCHRRHCRMTHPLEGSCDWGKAFHWHPPLQ
uniref:Uncharacterized protein n=1 Tax=Anguilla anguilla TaxID=7936 RepID=A0A0E9RN96_ANGAN